MYFHSVMRAFKKHLLMTGTQKKPTMDPKMFAEAVTRAMEKENYPVVNYTMVDRRRKGNQDYQGNSQTSSSIPPSLQALWREEPEELLRGPPKKRLRCSVLQTRYDKLKHQMDNILSVDDEFANPRAPKWTAAKRSRTIESLQQATPLAPTLAATLEY